MGPGAVLLFVLGVVIIFYLSIYLWSLRRQFQIKGKHILVSVKKIKCMNWQPLPVQAMGDVDLLIYVLTSHCMVKLP